MALPTSSASRPSKSRSTFTICTPPLLHRMGLDHERLTSRYPGRDFRLTDVSGNVIRELIA